MSHIAFVHEATPSTTRLLEVLLNGFFEDISNFVPSSEEENAIASDTPEIDAKTLNESKISGFEDETARVTSIILPDYYRKRWQWRLDIADI